MNISDVAKIETARDFLTAKYTDAAEPLWGLDDFGSPIYVDVGCATWVSCELFELQEDPAPVIEQEDEETIIVVIQAEVKWSHWDYTTIREFYVPISRQDDNWIVSEYDLNWEDISIDDFDDGQK